MLKEKILFFWENDEDIIKMFSLFFQQHAVLTANVETLDDCHRFCKSTPPNVLIVCCSPHQPSEVLSFIHRFRSDASVPYIPIIVGYANFANNEKEAGHHQMFRAGANACFSHPYDINDVLEQVKILVRDPPITNLADRQHMYYRK